MMDESDGVSPSVTYRRLFPEGGGEVRAVCVGDLWLGTNNVLKQDVGEKDAPGCHPQLDDYFESVVFYAASDYFIYCAACPSDKERSDAGKSSSRTGHELSRGSPASHDELLLSNVRISAADPAHVVGLAAIGARGQRNYSELVALDENGTATVFIGIHVRSLGAGRFFAVFQDFPLVVRTVIPRCQI